MTPTATTKTIADCEATCIPFPGYPNGVELFARVLGAGKPAVAALGGLFDAVKAGVDPQMLQAALGIGNHGALLAVALPALQAVDTAPLHTGTGLPLDVGHGRRWPVGFDVVEQDRKSVV